MPIRPVTLRPRVSDGFAVFSEPAILTEGTLTLAAGSAYVQLAVKNGPPQRNPRNLLRTLPAVQSAVKSWRAKGNGYAMNGNRRIAMTRLRVHRKVCGSDCR
jgi:hypothetical protein